MGKLSLKRQKLKFGYKVVTPTKVRTSAFAKDECLQAVVTYSTEYYAERPRNDDGKLFGPLAVFNNFDSADDFRLLISPKEVWFCVYQPSKAKSMWYLTRWGARRFFTGNVPKGTVYADFVRLIERMR